MLNDKLSPILFATHVGFLVGRYVKDDKNEPNIFENLLDHFSYIIYLQHA